MINMPEVKKSLKNLSYLLDTLGAISFVGASYVASDPVEKAGGIVMAGLVGAGAVINAKKEAGNFNYIVAAGYAGVGTAFLWASINDVLFGNFERLPNDGLWAAGCYLTGLGQALRRLATR